MFLCRKKEDTSNTGEKGSNPGVRDREQTTLEPKWQPGSVVGTEMLPPPTQEGRGAEVPDYKHRAFPAHTFRRMPT